MYLIICRQEWIRKERVQAFKTEKQEEEKRSCGFRHTLLPLIGHFENNTYIFFNYFNLKSPWATYRGPAP
jgi:hypothetical protein